MLKGTINREELDARYFFVECIKEPKSRCCAKGNQYRCDIEHVAGHVHFVIPHNDNNQRYLVNISEKHVDVEGIFEIVR